MKKLIPLIIFLALAHFVQAQTYNLSKETVQEYKKIYQEYKETLFNEKVGLATGGFKALFDTDPRTGIFEVVLSNSDWTSYASALKGLKPEVHRKIAEICGLNASNKRISQNANDKKFWQALQQAHVNIK